MEVFSNVLEVVKYLVLATAGTTAMCLVVSMFGGLLERLESTN